MRCVPGGAQLVVVSVASKTRSRTHCEFQSEVYKFGVVLIYLEHFLLYDITTDYIHSAVILQLFAMNKKF